VRAIYRPETPVRTFDATKQLRMWSAENHLMFYGWRDLRRALPQWRCPCRERRLLRQPAMLKSHRALSEFSTAV
jgi:hypothetical protein